MNSILLCSFLAVASSADLQVVSLQPIPLAEGADASGITRVTEDSDPQVEPEFSASIGCCHDACAGHGAGGCRSGHGRQVGCRQGCRCRPCGCLCQRHQLKQSLPTPWHAPGNMSQHLPYEAYPKTYYYFRPYNYLHIAEHQRESEAIGLDAQLPYSNAPFQDVYREFVPAQQEIPQPAAPLLIP